MTKRVSILGSTGSIGENTLDLIRRAPAGTFKIAALTANTNAQSLAQQAIEFGAEYVAIGDPDQYGPLKSLLNGHDVEIGAGKDSLIDAGAYPADFVMAAIIGAAGLRPTLAAVSQGVHIGLANKECLVCAGELFMKSVEDSGTKLLPVDSEHNAIFQVLEQDRPQGVKRLILTASGGPFREIPKEDLNIVTAAQALNHPVWDMGAKITIDSATLMNKGLELIEASYLFGRPSQEIDVVIHPQSIVHSMVEYIDGSVLSQMGSPDMRTPIAYALGWPERLLAPVERLDLTKLSGLTFFEPDFEKFPALSLARQALEQGGIAPNTLNAANEVAVNAFLNGDIGFTGISDIVARTLEACVVSSDAVYEACDIEAVIAADQLARQTAKDLIKVL